MKLNVLMVDEDEVATFVSKLLVKNSGLSEAVISFTDAEEALDYLNKHVKAHDHYLIMLEIVLRNSNSWKLIEAIEQAPYCKQVSIVVVTVSLEERIRQRALQHPIIIDYVEKPLNVGTCAGIKKSFSLRTFN